MKIVADANIPWVQHYFGFDADIILKPGREIVREDVQDADILLVRSVTQVNEKLLKNTAVKFVGSATLGFDHLDLDWLQQAGIRWSLAKGSNAQAVVEYVICTIAALQKMNFLTDKKMRAGIIGAGEIGQRVAIVLKFLGFEVVLCDPFRPDLGVVPLSELNDLDFITLHTPLTRTGDYPTYHLLQKDFFTRQKKNCILLNTARGSVINFEDLKQYGEELVWCLDVWENEPEIDFKVLDLALLATPHIAGYSVQSKYRGIEMLYQAAVQQGVLADTAEEDVPYPTQEIDCENAKMDWRDAVLKIFDPRDLTQTMKQRLIEGVKAFDQLRKEFNFRNEFAFVKMKNMTMSATDKKILAFFGIDA